MAQLLASRYEVGPLLGTGGMARVVRGRDTRLDRPVAIKLVPADAIDPAGRERFGREARSSAGFDHPNAVTAFDAGESDGYLFLVMELVDGSSLAELLAQRGPLPFDEIVRIEDGMLAALGAAHAAGIVHRDVKPGNVLLDVHGRVKLADFGIARRLDDLTSDLTGVGRFIGTPKYLAPEQIAGDPATPASDLYAAGVVLYEMVAGTPPFDGPSPMELAWAHHHAPVPEVRVARPDVPPALAATIATAMAKDPSHRFATADAMRRALTSPPAPTMAGAATALLAAPVLPPTVVGPASSPPPPGALRSDPRQSSPRRRWGWLVALAVLLAAAAAAIVLGRNDDSPDPPPSSTVATAVPAADTATETSTPITSPSETSPPVTTAAPQTTPAPTDPPATDPPETDPPATEPPVTDPPSPELPNDLDELLGVPSDLYGPRTDDLLDELVEVGGDPERARQLLERANEWIQDGELEPGLLPVLDQLFGPLAAQAGNNGQGGGDGGGNGGDDGGDDGGGGDD